MRLKRLKSLFARPGIAPQPSLQGFEEYETRTRTNFVIVGSLFVSAVSAGALVIGLVRQDVSGAVIPAFGVLVFPATMAARRWTGDPAGIAIPLLTFLFCALVAGPFVSLISSLFLFFPFVYPLIVFYLLGKKRGLRAVLALMLALGIIIGLAAMEMIPDPYPRPILLSGVLAYLGIGGLAYLVEYREEKITGLMEAHIYYDPLTGLPNRTLLLRQISDSASPALLLINIDGFKEINLTYGYIAGDRVLQSVAERLSQVVPDSVVGVYRLNADEFAVLMDRGNDARFERNVTHVASLITRFLRHEKCMYENVEIRVQTSMGIAIDTEDRSGSLFAHADLALQTARGTNSPYLFYQDALGTKKRYKENIKWANVLTNALDNNRIIPYYQPIVSNETGEVVKHECLVRLIDDNGQIVGPGRFLDIAKKSRLYTRITKILLRMAAEFVKQRRTGVTINLSVDDLIDESVPEYIDKILNESPRIGSRICFEITESEGIENFEQVYSFIKSVKSRGCQIAIDDFGSGYSNFDYLFRLQVDILKIDGSLIQNILSDPNSHLIVANIAAFAGQMGIKTVAEFVDSEELLQEVKRLGISLSQGYYLGEPSPAYNDMPDGGEQPGGSPD